MKVAQLCLTLCDPLDYIVYGILQARILEWVAVPFSRGSSQPRDQTQDLPHCRQILYQLSHQGSPKIVKGLLKCSFFLYLIGSSCEVDSASLITEQFFSQRKRN